MESVAWASLRKDTLSGVFFMLTLLAYLRAVERPTIVRHGLVTLAFVAAVLAKPTVMPLPFLLLLLDQWPLRRLGADGIEPARLARATAEKLPLLVVVVVASALTVWAQHSYGAVVAAQNLPLASRIANAVVAYGDYLRTSLWPTDLAAFYPAHVEGVPQLALVVSALVLGAVTLLCLRERTRRPWMLVGWLWFLGMLVPSIGLVQVGSQARADRYMYLPLIGLSILPIWALAELAGRRRAWRPAIVTLGSVWLLTLAVVAHRQVGVWQDSVTLFTHARAVTRENVLTYAHLSEALAAQDRHAEAAEAMREALRLGPDYLEMQNNLAWLLVTHPEIPPREPGESMRLALRVAERTGGRNPQTLYTLALAQARAGRLEEASRTALRAAGIARAAGATALAEELTRKASELRMGTIEP